MSVRSRSLVWLVVAAAVFVVLALAPTPIGWMNAPLALWLPGHLVLTIVDPAATRCLGVSRLVVGVLLSLASYPIIALASFVVVQRFTAASTIVAVVLLAVLAVIRVRTALDVAPNPPWAALRAVGSVPFVAVTAAVSIAVAGVVLLPRPAPGDYVRVSLAGPWALVDGPVAVTGDDEYEVMVEIVNESVEEHTLVFASRFLGALDESESSVVSDVTVGPGERAIAVVVVRPPVGCGTRLLIEPVIIDADTPLDPAPLVVSFDRPTSTQGISCAEGRALER